MKKFGRLLLCFVPMVSMLLLQVILSMVMVTVKVSKFTLAHPDDIQAIQEYSVNIATDTQFLLTVLSVFEVVAFIVVALIYFTTFEGSVRTIKGHVQKFTFFKIIALFSGLELAVSALLTGVGLFAPSILENYQSFIQQSGLADLSVMSTILTLICAPVVEELAFRGITMKLAERVSVKFWIVNVIQALTFGIMHGNLVQGIYTFALGLVLGYVAYKYKSLWVAIAGHLAFNFCGTYIATLIYGGDSGPSMVKIVIAFVAGVLISIAGFMAISKEESYVENIEEIKEETVETVVSDDTHGDSL